MQHAAGRLGRVGIPGRPQRDRRAAQAFARCRTSRAIEGHLFEQAAMSLSPMSALERITDSSQTTR